jgi:enoyl-CoA hydratase/carnithine racemase
MNILDIEVPMIAALNGPVRVHSEYVLLCDAVIATPDGLPGSAPFRVRDRSG